MKVFLGGTCAGPDYRKALIPLLDKNNINYYNPVVEDWNEDCIAEEERQKLFECDIHLYVLTPYLLGCYSVAEIMTSCLGSWPNKKTTIFAYYKEYKGKEFDEAQVKSFNAVGKMVQENGQFWLKDFDDINKLVDAFVEYKKGLTNNL